MKVWVGLVKKWVLRQFFEILPSNLIKKKKLLSAKRLIKFLKKIFKQIYRAVANLKPPGDNNAVMEKQCFICPRKKTTHLKMNVSKYVILPSYMCLCVRIKKNKEKYIEPINILSNWFLSWKEKPQAKKGKC